LIDTATLRKLSAASGADPRTIDKVLLGKRVRGDVGVRVLAILLECGITPLAADATGNGGQP
jgi:hypothetical protein